VDVLVSRLPHVLEQFAAIGTDLLTSASANTGAALRCLNVALCGIVDGIA
jgi:hypothetical protein